MEASNDIMIRISPNEGKITVEEDAQGVFSRKSITEEDLLRCFKDSLRTADEGYHSGFLPLNTISLYQSETVKRFVLWHPRLYADVSVYDAPSRYASISAFPYSLRQAHGQSAETAYPSQGYAGPGRHATLCSDDHPGVRRSSGGYENPRLSSVGTYGPAAPIEYAGICNRAYGIPLSKNCG